MMRNPYNGNERVMMGNGQGLLISSLGQSNFYSHNSPNVKLTLKDLLHVPTISKNLLSVSKFAQDNNVIFEFHPYKCFVKSQASRQILLEGQVGVDGLYIFQPFQFLKTPGAVSPSASNKASSMPHSVVFNSSIASLSSVRCNKAITTACNSEFHTWHLRLGHAHSKAVQAVLKLCNVSVPNTYSNTACTFCCVGKSHKLHAPSSLTVYTQPFEVVHCDLWGPAPFVSSTGYNYYISFVDTFTKFTWIYFLKAKSDALQAVKQFLALIQTQFNLPVKSIQSDWGGEFRPFTSLLNSLGTLHRLTCPYTSHQNGTVERKHTNSGNGVNHVVTCFHAFKILGSLLYTSSLSYQQNPL
jgi:histone deacetylase 1/2